MIEFKDEWWLENHISQNFSKFFPFKYVGSQQTIFREDNSHHDRIDLVGEDDNNVYVIEVKRDYVRPTEIHQVNRYISAYKKLTDKNIIGYIMSPYISKNVRKLAEQNNILIYELTDYVCIAGYSCCSHKLKKVLKSQGKPYIKRTYLDDPPERWNKGVRSLMISKTTKEC